MQRGLAIVGVVLAALMLAPLPAAADGMPRASRPDPYAYSPGSIVVDYDWSGLYVGGHAGGAYTRWDWTFTNPTERLDKTDTGFGGGAQVGVQRQWGRTVLGAEASYTWGDTEQTLASVVPVMSHSAELKNIFLVSGRLGVALDNMLAYAKAGYATADVEFRSSVAATGVVTTSSSGREHGWVAGLGLDYGLTPNISIGAEYNYIHLNVEGRDQIPTPAGVAGSQVVDGGIDIQTVMARLNFKFGRRPEGLPIK